MTTEADGPRATARPAVRAQAEPDAKAFRELLSYADELMRLRRWTTALTAQRNALAWDSFCVLLDAALPHEEPVETRVARALHLDDDVIARMRARSLSPACVPAEPLTQLAQCMRLEWREFHTLVCRDVEWFETHRGPDPEVTGDTAKLTRRLRVAWERAARDDAPTP